MSCCGKWREQIVGANISYCDVGKSEHILAELMLARGGSTVLKFAQARSQRVCLSGLSFLNFQSTISRFQLSGGARIGPTHTMRRFAVDMQCDP